MIITGIDGSVSSRSSQPSQLILSNNLSDVNYQLNEQRRSLRVARTPTRMPSPSGFWYIHDKCSCLQCRLRLIAEVNERKQTSVTRTSEERSQKKTIRLHSAFYLQFDLDNVWKMRHVENGNVNITRDDRTKIACHRPFRCPGSGGRQ